MAENDAVAHNNWPGIVLAGIVLLLTAFNALSTWLFSSNDSENDILWAIVVGVWVFEPILFGIWTALGSGSLMTRLPIVLPCLLMLFVAPGLNRSFVADMESSEFIVTVLAGVVIFAVSTVLFLIVRWFTRFRIEQAGVAQPVASPHVRFGMKYLLTVITIYAVLFGMATQLRFRTQPRPPSFITFGPEFYIYVLAVGGASVTGMILPTVAIPFFMLSTKVSVRAIPLLLFCWVVVTIIATAILDFNEEGPPQTALPYVLLLQVGATFTGILAAAPLRLVGFRLVRDIPNATQSPGPNIAISQ